MPPAAVQDGNSRELVRAWVANQGLHCSLDVGAWDKDEGIGWGILISDIARHVADALERTKGKDKAEFLRDVRRVFNDELDAPSAETQGSFVS